MPLKPAGEFNVPRQHTAQTITPPTGTAPTFANFVQIAAGSSLRGIPRSRRLDAAKSQRVPASAAVIESVGGQPGCAVLVAGTGRKTLTLHDD
jgi:hypothetical protein